MKKHFFNLISCIVTISLTITVLGRFTTMTERKDSVAKYRDFFEQESDFDVLFFGTSHMLNAVLPMELWSDYGIVSYNMAGHGSRIPTSYWTMRNALEYTTPQVVVIDCYSVSYEEKCSDVFSYMHYSFDAFPLTKTKIQAVFDLLEDAPFGDVNSDSEIIADEESRTKLGLLWDFSTYHSRWDEINQSDFDVAYSPEKGAEMKVGIEASQINQIHKDLKKGQGSIGDQYLRNMIKYCQDNGINVLLTYLPFGASDDFLMEANYIYDLAEEYDVPYVNFFDIGNINYQTDLFDSYSHLNASGAKKVTEYLGKYLFENYDLPNRQYDDKYAGWYVDYDEYRGMKYYTLCSCQNIKEYLMLLAEENYEVSLWVKSEAVRDNSNFKELSKNANLNIVLKEEIEHSVQIEVRADGYLVDTVSFDCTVDGDDIYTNAVFR